MARLQVYYAHPAPGASRANRPMAAEAEQMEGIDFIDLYRRYPRANIDIPAEQERLLGADVLLFQFPLYWYSTPPLMKEWIDLVLEHGFAYGAGGDQLTGKVFMLALTAAGPAEAYRPDGYQRHSLRSFLLPLEQTARLCGMRFPAPYVLFEALEAEKDGRLIAHLSGYRRLLEAIRDDRYDFATAEAMQVITADALPFSGDA